MDKMFAKISKNNFGMKLVLVHELSSTHSFQITSRAEACAKIKGLCVMVARMRLPVQIQIASRLSDLTIASTKSICL
jgi:hypothetical protein